MAGLQLQTDDRDRAERGWADVALLLWANKWVLMAIAVLGVLAGLTYSLVSAKWYRAEVVLVPTSGENVSALSGNLSALSGLIGLRGFGNRESLTTESIAMLKSGDFTEGFIQSENLLPVLFEEFWDETEQRWISQDEEDHPDLRDGVRRMQETVLTVIQDPQTSLVRVAVEWTDPVLAASWANSLVERLNGHMRQRALKEAESNIVYLKSQMAENTLAPLRSSISGLLEAELEKVMLARGNVEFIFRVVDSAVAPKQPVRPRILVVVVLSAFVFTVIGFLGILASAAIRGLGQEQ
ncbi:MAG: Wzz/FepE/Etk N-terminal domain-containing protein [Woeseiaceae bacterium]|nr:Wzz/FepE/Etk N-terminal domain-containing protein [Woeseiaceae bacterium]